MSKVFGFVAEPHRNGYFLVSRPATKDGETITCHDLSGFMGSWCMKTGGVFFESENGDSLCCVALAKAQQYADAKSKNRTLGSSVSRHSISGILYQGVSTLPLNSFPYFLSSVM